MGTDHSDDFSLDDEQRALVKDCLRKEGISLPPERFERLVRKIERAVWEFPTTPPATFRHIHDAVRRLWQLCHDDDPSPDQIRACIRNLPREAVDYLDQRAPQVMASLFPLEAPNTPFQIWAASAEREKLLELMRALTEQEVNVVPGRSRSNGNRSMPRMEPRIMGQMRGAKKRHHPGGRPRHEEQQKLITSLAMDWAMMTEQPPEPGRSDQTGFGDLCHCVFQWLDLTDGSATQALRQYWDTINQYKSRETVADFMKRHGEEF
jgi:hypothetical protein